MKGKKKDAAKVTATVGKCQRHAIQSFVLKVIRTHRLSIFVYNEPVNGGNCFFFTFQEKKPKRTL